MSMIIKKRQLITATLVIALGAAIFVNWYYTKPEVGLRPQAGAEARTEENVGKDSDNLGDAQYVIAGTRDSFFAESAMDRKRSRDEAADLLNGIIKDSGSASSAVKEATQELAALTEAIKLEADMETLIKAKTGSKCLVVFDGKTADVILPPNVLTDTGMIQIKDIVVNKTGLSTEKITIVELS
ncbi:MAG: SpoIIIAH-like family protein [Oscillospiraceae bacterium]|nr:SpoIIIAH-like family protein [Oscillospiraceae bacterium]